jgi:hypothetical protein
LTTFVEEHKDRFPVEVICSQTPRPQHRQDVLRGVSCPFPIAVKDREPAITAVPR